MREVWRHARGGPKTGPMLNVVSPEPPSVHHRGALWRHRGAGARACLLPGLPGSGHGQWPSRSADAALGADLRTPVAGRARPKPRSGRRLFDRFCRDMDDHLREQGVERPEGSEGNARCRGGFFWPPWYLSNGLAGRRSGGAAGRRSAATSIRTRRTADGAGGSPPMSRSPMRALAGQDAEGAGAGWLRSGRIPAAVTPDRPTETENCD